MPKLKLKNIKKIAKNIKNLMKKCKKTAKLIKNFKIMQIAQKNYALNFCVVFCFLNAICRKRVFTITMLVGRLKQHNMFHQRLFEL